MSPARTTDVFTKMMLVITGVAGVAHLAFIFLFDSIGATALSRANIGSVLFYALAALMVQQGRLMAAFLLTVIEIILHGAVATAVIGWGAGFHYYIILIIPVAIVSTLFSAFNKGLLAVGVGLCYMVMDALCREAEPAVVIAPAAITSLHYFNQASTLVMLGLLATVYYRLVKGAEDRLRDQACTDPLTSLRNRRFAMEAAQHEAAVYERGGRPLAIVIADIDHFKRINDDHGHAVGDSALKAVAKVLRDGVREIDHVARWGGEEFLLLLPATEAREAERVCERLRQDVEALGVQHTGRKLSLSITLGVTVMRGGESVDQALMRADRALYEGKDAGRNRVVLAGQN